MKKILFKTAISFLFLLLFLVVSLSFHVKAASAATFEKSTLAGGTGSFTINSATAFTLYVRGQNFEVKLTRPGYKDFCFLQSYNGQNVFDECSGFSNRSIYSPSTTYEISTYTPINFPASLSVGTYSLAVYNLSGGQMELQHSFGSAELTIPDSIITSHDPIPNPSFMATPSTVILGSPVSFDDSATTNAVAPTGINSQFVWDWQSTPNIYYSDTDGGATGAYGVTSFNPNSYTYTQPGTFTARLTVENVTGFSQSVQKTIHVIAPPVAVISSPPSCVPSGTAYSYSGASSHPQGDATITGYSWTFDDGGVGSGVNVSHIFSTAGTHQITLIVSDNNGLVGTSTISVNVHNSCQTINVTANQLLNNFYGAGGNYDVAPSFTLTLPGGSTTSGTVSSDHPAQYLYTDQPGTYSVSCGPGYYLAIDEDTGDEYYPPYTVTQPSPQTLAGSGTLTFMCTYLQPGTGGTINVNSNLSNVNITVNPGGYTGTVTIPNAQVTATTTATAGTYTASCPSQSGYTITNPPSQVLVAGSSITFVCNYSTSGGGGGGTTIPPAFLKDLGYTTAETLLFTPSTSHPNKQWSLLDGVGAIAISGTNSWQESSAEVLYVGNLAVANIYKTSDSHYVIAGSSANYKLDFDAEMTKNQQYSATITDTISVSDGQYGEVSIDPTGTTATSTINAIDSACSAANITAGVTTAINDNQTGPKTITFTLPATTRGCSFELSVKLNFSDKVISNTVIHDEADFNLLSDGAKAIATYDTMAVGTFTQETVGGDIYSKGALNFGQIPATQSGAKYVLSADGNVQSTSEEGWSLGSYGIRSGTTDDFNPDTCVSGSACQAMNDNIARLEKGATSLIQNNINGTFPSTLNGVAPEGWVYYKNGDLTIGGDTFFQGKGTIIVDGGNLIINGNVSYANSNSILGIIVKNGNVIIAPAITTVNGIFYVFSAEAPPNGNPRGQFIVNSNISGTDVQLTIHGSVIASGYYDSVSKKRMDAFVLARRYAGDPTALNAYITANPGAPIPDDLLNPAELFLYDSRVIVNPPPGFEGKIASGM